MALHLDFPATPSLGQVYPSPSVAGVPTYTWDGEKWTIASAPIGGDTIGKAAVTTSLTPPAGPGDGDLWFEEDTGLLFIYWNDGTSSQWVAITSGLTGPGAVRYDIKQGLTGNSKYTARENIYAAPLDALAFNGMQVNGGFEVSQERGTSGLQGAGYICDQWRMDMSGTMVVASSQVRTSIVNGSPCYLNVFTSTAQPALGAAHYFFVQQHIEGYRVSRLGLGSSLAQSFTIAFVSAHSRVGTYTVWVRNATVSRSYCATYTQNVANAAEYKVVTIPGDGTGTWEMGNLIGMSIGFTFACGSTFTAPTANTWLAGSYIAAPGQVNAATAVNDDCRIASVAVLPGSQAPANDYPTSYILRPFDQELVLCQRFWETSWRGGVNAGTAGDLYDQITWVQNGGGGFGNPGFVKFKQVKRAMPTFQNFSPNTGAGGNIRNVSANVDFACSVLNVATNGWDSFGNNRIDGNVYAAHYIADARF